MSSDFDTIIRNAYINGSETPRVRNEYTFLECLLSKCCVYVLKRYRVTKQVMKACLLALRDRSPNCNCAPRCKVIKGLF